MRFTSGDDTNATLDWIVNDKNEIPQPEISFEFDNRSPDSTSGNRGDQGAICDTRSGQPQPPSPSIRKELTKTIDRLRLASDAMLTAYEGTGIDVVELANAVQEYRECVEVMWRYREFGMEAWRSVIVFCQQALCENMNDEQMTPRQCCGWKRIANGYLSNRLLAKEDVKEVMLILKESGFDLLLFFSPVNGAKKGLACIAHHAPPLG